MDCNDDWGVVVFVTAICSLVVALSIVACWRLLVKRRICSPAFQYQQLEDQAIEPCTNVFSRYHYFDHGNSRPFSKGGQVLQ
jgi:hypothetical protein